MSLVTVKRNIPVYATLKSTVNTGATASTKAFNFADSAITNNGITLVSPSSIRVPDSGDYEVTISLGAYSPSAFIVKFQYGINSVWTDIATSTSSSVSADRFNLVIPLVGNDLLEFRAVAVTGSITSTFCGFRYETTALKDTTTIKRI